MHGHLSIKYTGEFISNFLCFATFESYSHMFRPLHVSIFRWYMLYECHIHLKCNVIIGKW